MDPSGEVTLYAFSYRAPSAATAWTPLCHPGPDGLAMGFPLPGGAGPAEPDGPVLSTAAFRLTCTSGAVGKCVRAGYKPWKLANDGATSLAPYHEACTRMIRADYCGNGTPHTREGTMINIFDRLGVQTRDDDPKMEFEAAWGPAGAVCVRKPRIPGLTSLDALVAMSPTGCGTGSARHAMQTPASACLAPCCSTNPTRQRRGPGTNPTGRPPARLPRASSER